MMNDLFDPPGVPDPFPITYGIPVGRDSSDTQRPKWERPDLKAAFDKMRVGGSIDIYPHHCGGAPLIVVQNIVTGAVLTYCKDFTPGARKYTTRQIGGRFVRCWRLI